MKPTNSTKPSSFLGLTPHAAQLPCEQKPISQRAPQTIKPAVQLTPQRRDFLVSRVPSSPSDVPGNLLSEPAQTFIRALDSIRRDEIKLNQLKAKNRQNSSAPSGPPVLPRSFDALSQEEKKTPPLARRSSGSSDFSKKIKAMRETERKIEQNYDNLDQALKTICEESTNQNTPDSKTTKDILTLIKWISEKPIAKTNEIFGEALDALLNFLPADFPLKAQNLIYKDSESGRKSHIVKPAAVEIWFRFFEEEYSFDKDDISCQKLSDLPNLVKQMTERAVEGEIKGWAISNDEDKDDPHMVPVFAKFQESSLHLFISDSLGYVKSGGTSAPIIAKLLDVSSDLPDSLAPTIHVAIEQRQHAARGCWAFTANDLKNQYELHRSDSTGAIDSVMQGEVLGDNKLVRFTLPQTMMKMSQSMKSIADYSAQNLAGNADYFAQRRLPLSVNGEAKQFNHKGDLLSAVSEHTIINDDKPISSFADLKRQAYILNILIQACGQKESVTN